MATSMDIDPPAAMQSIEFHPLAIVHMSDQYTRITTGGSPLPQTSPVVGLLFGKNKPNDQKTDDSVLEIVDADDIATDLSETTRQQISLHQAVFPLHHVVGWYRVSPDATPSAADLDTTKQLGQYFREHNESISTFVFCFCHVNGDPDNLPITLFQVEDEGNDGGILVALDEKNWNLETSDAEKIAVETVIREQPLRQKQEDQQNAQDGNKKSSKKKQAQSPYVAHVESLQHALDKMKDRFTILVQFVQDTHDGKVPFDPSLMRQVQALVCQLGPLLAESSKGGAVMDEEGWLAHMAVAARTVQAVQGYTEKVRLLQEHRLGGTGRRF